MACGCRGGGTQGSVTTSGKTVLGYEVTYPDGTTTLFQTRIKAQISRRSRGGGTIREVTS